MILSVPPIASDKIGTFSTPGSNVIKLFTAVIYH